MSGPSPRAADVVGVLLAGGQARRMGGGDKCLRPLGGRPLLAHVIERLRPQVETLVLNANGEPGRFAAFGLPVLPDVLLEFAGPLAGVLTGMEWARTARPDCAWIVTVATDTPFLPPDLVARLRSAAIAADLPLACASSQGQAHPVFGLWPVRLAADLRHAMTVEALRKVDRWTARHGVVEVPFEPRPIDPFFNANQPEDLIEAEALLARLRA